MINPTILLTPGPTPVPEAVRKLMAEPIFHHRTPRYRKIFGDVSERLKKVFMTRNPVYTFAGSGSLAMEAAIVNFHSTGDKILIGENGKFAERFTAIARAFGLNPIVIKMPLGEAVPPAMIEEALKKDPDIKAVCVQLCETSTAVLNDIKAIGAVVAKTNALLIVDAISGLGADRIETDNWNVDLVIAGSQKALMLPPGLAFLSVSEKARARMATAKLPRYYYDLKYYEKSLRDSDTPWTPALTLVIGLQKSLEMIEAEGLENVFKRCSENAQFTRDTLRKMGLNIFSKAPSSTVTAACMPEGVDGEKLTQYMRDEKGIAMAGGQGDQMKGKVVRICHMGAITRKDLETGLKVLDESLKEKKSSSGSCCCCK
ncbi:MAG TPA: alanine--glyoxylate aminotransferase family protein [Candidatus Omnitrophota bacterium]|jgi:aspartate aminotransferase-like enzyme|nr:alanine--glyoxylate aminotransferase family protein [Candidatus Omnitrophota bacterium]HPW64629.1 alanine--glyoxylate aminotransferase family protein [Candidatus Omnitrophota bacterium]HQB94856.1 alanine--glyoxylate aminotransferase family protein [Candidatus Omnitrophota bacterium]